MTRRRRLALILLAVAILALLAAPVALAGAGGGSSGFSGGGGGRGGGGFGGGGGGSGKGFALYLIFRALFDIALIGHGLGFLVLVGLVLIVVLYVKGWPKVRAFWQERRTYGRSSRKRTAQRTRRVQLAAAEAGDEDPAFLPENVISAATNLYVAIQAAWDQDDRIRLRGLVAPTLLQEWERRLDDFRSKGWHNRVQPIDEPKVEYVGLENRGGTGADRVIVRIEAKVRDYVVDNAGRHIKRTGQFTETVRTREFWTLIRRGDHWILSSIEQGAEGAHALDAAIVPTQWSDEGALKDEALIEGAVAEAVPEGTKISEVADLQYDGDSRAAALDLSLADGRFAPDLLEIAARRAVAAWAEAVDGDDARLLAIADRAAARELLHPGDPSGRTRLVVRGPKVKQIRVAALDAGAEPPTMTLDVDVSGRRYVQDRDTTAVVSGSLTRESTFTEHWTLALTDDPAQPWRIVGVGAPAAGAGITRSA
ncbi:MAG: Tim44-like domain-containing protein [Actinomycetota bacterium]|nr:Tim44-like domain-containing protein [Actinomycetota bacterium]